MKNYISINNQRIELTEDQIKRIVEAYDIQQKQLAEYVPGSIAKIGDYELVVLEQRGEETVVICKDLFGEPSAFSATDNNYADSIVDCLCENFADQIAETVGSENIVEHTVDLTSEDGLKDYGCIQRRASLLTADMYRHFVGILDLHKLNEWWWLATAHSTKRHENDRWAKCVSPSGGINNVIYGNVGNGVRPFCILKSTIFVSK